MGIFSIFKKNKTQRVAHTGNIAPVSESPTASVMPEKSASLSQQLDCSGLRCPMPIVMISKKFNQMNFGDELQVLATDPAFRPDLEAWLRKTGNSLVSFNEGTTQSAVIKKC
jgi:TusA-related sulfurtransferase